MSWWTDVADLSDRLAWLSASWIDHDATVEDGVTLDDRAGPIMIGAATRICAGAVIRGPVVIGRSCLIGNNAFVRGAALIGDGVRVGYAAEIKNSLIGSDVSIGPLCFIADSRVDDDAYLGALVRTSNQRLDRAEITVRGEDGEVATGTDKLGCWIGANASLGIQCIVLPGRTIAAGSLFEPRITIAKNLPAGRYRVRQELDFTPLEGPTT